MTCILGDPTTNEGCLSGHYWRGGSCTRCGEQLRCACGRFVTIEGLDEHLESACPLREPSDLRANGAAERDA